MGTFIELSDFVLNSQVLEDLANEFKRFSFKPEEGITYENVCQKFVLRESPYIWPVILRKNANNGRILSFTYLTPIRV
jgi:hypothetical protein